MLSPCARWSLLVTLASSCGGRSAPPASDAALTRRLTAVATDVERVLAARLTEAGGTYRPATLAVVDGDVATDCGPTAGLIGFYCDRSATLYVALGPYRARLRARGTGGHAAQAVIVAHELGHHLQALAGVDTNPLVDGQPDLAAAEAVELQAQCLAGVWSRHTTLAGLADDAVATRAVAPDGVAADQASGRHGTADLQLDAFTRGRHGGSLAACGLVPSSAPAAGP